MGPMRLGLRLPGYLRNPAVLYAVLVCMLPLLSLPVMHFDAELQKSVIAALGLGAALVATASILLLGRTTGGGMIRSVLFLSGVPLLTVAGISSWGSSIIDNFFGAGFEMGTVGAAFLFAATIAMCSFVPHAAIRAIMRAFVGAIALLAPLAFFSSGTTDWIELLALCAAALAVCGALFVGDRKSAWSAAYILAGTYFAGILFIALLQGVTHGGLPGSSEVRLSAKASGLITSSVYASGVKSALFGTGESFASTWARFGPAAAYGTPLWDYPPTAGSSDAFTIALQWGILGLISIFLAAAASAGLIRSRRDVAGAYAAPAVLAMSSLLIVLVLPDGIAPLLLLACGVGLSVRASAGDEQVYARGAYAPLLAAGMVLAGIIVACVSALQLIAAETNAQAVVEAHATPVDQARVAALATHAASVWEYFSYDIDASRAIFEKDIANGVYTESTSSRQLDEAVKKASMFADRAVAASHPEFSAVLYRASLYLALMAKGYEAAEGKAEISLNTAVLLAPNRPEMPYMYAVLALQRGDIMRARAYAQEALLLKPDYRDAQALIAQMSRAH